ncbi:hypothetical protein ACC736_37410, partial [Rhizobium ruizarguesonis]
DIMDLVERLFESLALSIHCATEFPFGDKTMSFKGPFKRVPCDGWIRVDSTFSSKMKARHSPQVQSFSTAKTAALEAARAYSSVLMARKSMPVASLT